MDKFITILALSGAVMATCWAQGPDSFRRCPNGKIGKRVCSGFFPNCPSGQFCFAPLDVGVCCRPSPPHTLPPPNPHGKCPAPPGCDTYLGGRRCGSSRRCRRGKVCCSDGCGRRMCMDPVFH